MSWSWIKVYQACGQNSVLTQSNNCAHQCQIFSVHFIAYVLLDFISHVVLLQENEFKAHKAILASCSSYFDKIITDPANVSHNIVLELSSISKWVIYLLYFIFQSLHCGLLDIWPSTGLIITSSFCVLAFCSLTTVIYRISYIVLDTFHLEWFENM